ncbi:MAG: outer membrane lipoprotein-sorting protein [Magnetococcales bacterium]|nr:outer membrane lipoprotein-sorting protein [Magnetococcales bacterium]
MKQFSGTLSIVCMVMTAVLIILPGQGRADDPQARQIMQKVQDRNDGDNRSSEMTMVLINKRGETRTRKIANFSRDKGKDSLSLMIFKNPPEVRNTGFLTYDYDAGDKEDDQWLYLPALKKTKRIASSDKSGSFMGSDFSYADMSDSSLDKYDYKLLKEMKVRGHKVWVIESKPRVASERKRTGYDKSLLLVRQDNYVVVRSVIWVSEGGKRKYLDVTKLKKIDGIWVATETQMTTKRGKQTLHKTILQLRDVKFNQNLDPNLFTVRQLEKGL